MTLRLILLRHAKSDWDDPLADDQDRVLNPRGVQSANALGQWLRSNAYIPEEILCSSARRTQQTYERIAPHLDETPEYHLKPQLYLAGSLAMLTHLKRAKASVVMMIGHNPGIAEFAENLLRSRKMENDFYRYPTGAVSIIDFEIDHWEGVEFGTGTLMDFTVPRRLLG
ncbi:MAG: histidine phosphatase family protein [Pseudoruegeria sp.]